MSGTAAANVSRITDVSAMVTLSGMPVSVSVVCADAHHPDNNKRIRV